MRIKLGALRNLIRESLDAEDPLNQRDHFRLEIFRPAKVGGEYYLDILHKANEGETPAEFARRFGLKFISREDYEGQDIIKSYTWRLEKDGDDLYVMSIRGLHPKDYSNSKFGFKACSKAQDNQQRAWFELGEKITKIYTDNLKKYAQPEAPESGIFGRYAFASDGKRPDTPDEDDTPEEKKFFKDVSNIVKGGTFDIDNEDIKIYRQAQNDGYENVLQTKKLSSIRSVYRGMRTTEDWIKKFLGQEGPLSDTGSEQGDFTFSPKRNASSWSRSKEVADGMAQIQPGLKEKGLLFGVVLTADCSESGPNTFIHVTQPMYTLMKPEFDNERESIAYGDVHVKNVEWKRLYPG